MPDERTSEPLKAERIQSRLKAERIQTKLEAERVQEFLADVPGWSVDGDGEALIRNYHLPSVRASAYSSTSAARRRGFDFTASDSPSFVAG